MARYFDGTNSMHLDNSSPPFTVTAPNGFSFCAWTQNYNLLTQLTIVTIGNSGSGTNRWSLGMSASSQVGAQAFDTTFNAINSTTTIVDPNWHLCVATFASNDTNKVAYLDGGGNTSGGLLRTPVPGTPVVRVAGSPNGTGLFTGLIAHVAMWDVVLTAAEALALVTNPPSSVHPGNLQEYWPLTGNLSPEPSIGIQAHSLTVTGSTFNADDPYGAPVTLMGQAWL